MSQHNSLRSDSVGVKHRNVFKRGERVKKLQDIGKWNRESVFYLPKVKSMKIKVKKSAGKEEKEGEAKPAAGAAAKAAAPAAKK